ncbi:MAG: hypothetical protein HGB31_08410 [Erysipelotrichaceae bacterium]|nr:hypothetical protein [Erysipelotrichaceae bacterium]
MAKKIIISRKGLDSSNSNIPSPILQNKTMLSIPIPNDDKTKYSDLTVEKISYSDLLIKLNHEKSNFNDKCHLDPDIYMSIKGRPKNWRACFGQESVAQLHLQNKGISIGDIFLFFGWFKETEGLLNVIKYKKGAQDIHAFFGYLQIGEILTSTNDMQKVKWHPHADYGEDDHNTIYVASEKLLNTSHPGYGVFRFSEEINLTKRGYSRSKWELPSCFKGKDISYHSETSQKKDYFQSAMIGQEFVLESDDEIERWIISIVNTNRVDI